MADGAGRGPGPVTVVVVGGGIAGLSAALTLSSAPAGARVVVLEASPRLGGKLASAEFGGRALDLGPDAFLARRPEAVGLCRELGLEDDLVAPGQRSAFVLVRGRLRPLPAGLALGVPTRLGPLARSGVLSPPGLARAALDLVAPWAGGGAGEADRAVAAITTARLGREVTELLVDPLIGGIHAGDTARMSAAAVFPPLLAAAHEGGSLMRALRAPATDIATTAATAAAASTGAGTTGAVPAPGDASPPPVFLTVRGGLGRLVDRLAAVLGERGVALHTGRPVQRIEPAAPGPVPHRTPAGAPRRWTVHHGAGAVEADAVVVAVPAGVAGALIAPLDATAGAALGSVEYADVAVVTLRLAAGDLGRRLDGTGYLVPRRAGGLVTACTWLTSKWPELARPGDVVVRASAGRAGDHRAAAVGDEELVAAVVAELAPVLGLRGAPLERLVTRWPGAFPQYALGHLDRVAAVEAGGRRLGTVAVAGAALHGVGIPACIGSGRAAARAVLASMAGAAAAVS